MFFNEQIKNAHKNTSFKANIQLVLRGKTKRLKITVVVIIDEKYCACSTFYVVIFETSQYATVTDNMMKLVMFQVFPGRNWCSSRQSKAPKLQSWRRFET